MFSKEKTACSDLKDESDHLFVKPMPLKPRHKLLPTTIYNTSSSNDQNTTTTATVCTVTNVLKTPSCKRKSKFSSVPPFDSVTTYAFPKEKRICPDASIRLSSKSDTGYDAAKARAEEINAKLKASGKFSTETTIKSMPVQGTNLLSVLQISQITKVNEMYAAKIDINDLPSGLRTNLTQLSVQETLRNVAKSSVLIKGQYLTSAEKKGLDGIEKQLHLLIQALTKERVAKTIASVKDLILNFNSPKPAIAVNGIKPVIPINGNMANLPSLPTGSYVQEKVFVGMDNAPPGFDLKRKLLGDNYEHFTYIANRNGSKVILRGRGSGFLEPTSGREAFESMYIFISHPQQAGVNASKKLVMDLIENVRSSLSTYMSQFSTPSLSYYPYGGSYSTPMINSTPASYQTFNGSDHTPQNSKLGIPDPTNLNTKCPGPVPPPIVSMATNPPSTSGRAELLDKKLQTKVHHSLATPSITTSKSVVSGPKTDKPEASTTAKAKQRRRFQEEVPDYTSILGYKPLDYGCEYHSHKKNKRNFCEGEMKEKEEIKLENNKSDQNQPDGSGMPFWMSMN